jgi:hypothetical protein
MIFLMISKFWCMVTHFNQYLAAPQLDTETHKGIYCKKCKCSFLVSKNAYRNMMVKKQ